jgi:AcrR family transcriptional regulator
MARSGTKGAVGQTAAKASGETRRALVEAAVTALREDGFSGASARSIARRAGCNQGLVFYYFGTVVNLLLAALDEVSAVRMARYRAEVERSAGLAGLATAARSIFEEDLDAGHVAVLFEMIAGSSSTPGLAAEVAQRLAPWRAFAADTVAAVLEGTPLAGLVASEETGHAVVALYLGLEMLAHLDGDRTRASALFDRVDALAVLLGGDAGPHHAVVDPTRDAAR